MKKKSLLTIVAMLSVLILGIGTAHAIKGTDDPLPGQDLVFPIICGVAPDNNLNTLWAIADKAGDVGTLEWPCDGDLTGTKRCQYTIRGHFTLHERVKSTIVLDRNFHWTPYDVVVGNCKDFVKLVDPSNLQKLVTTIGGTPYYVGYVKVKQEQFGNAFGQILNRWLPWVYYVDAPIGSATGFNGFSAEDGSGPELEEGKVAVTAHTIYPRFFLNNPNAGTKTWWIFTLGRPDINTLISDVLVSRRLECDFYDEEEGHGSNVIPIPNELNIINIVEYLPSLPHHPTPPDLSRNGFAVCSIIEKGTWNQQLVNINGTFDPPALLGFLENSTGYYTMLGMSWQRVEANDAAVVGNWDAMNTIHRIYCSGVSDAVQDSGSGNVDTCTCTGNGCTD